MYRLYRYEMFLTRIINSTLRLSSEKIPLTRYSHLHNSGPSVGKYSVVSVYHLSKVEDVDRAVHGVRKWLQQKGATGRFQINSQGVNCQLCFNSEDQVDTLRYLLSQCLKVDEEDLRLKVQKSDFVVYKRLRIKKKLVEYLDDDADISERGEHLDREQWNKLLEDHPDSLVLDIRNDYEWEVGRFKQAERPQLSRFREFPRLADEVAEKVSGQDRKVMMYCTGGIRCEVFSSMLVKRGVQQVYQLQDGVLGYGEGSAEETRHWEGNLFVFDDRLVVPIDGVAGGEKDKPISRCKHCGELSEMVYNCHGHRCNDVFVSCMKCAAALQGYCSETCRAGAREIFRARNYRQWRGKLVGRGEHYRQLADKLTDTTNRS